MGKCNKISIILPYAEHFSKERAGAISLYVNDVTRKSQYKECTTVFGRDGVESFPAISYVGIKPKWRLVLGRNKGLAEAFVQKVKDDPPEIIEVHNRPALLPYLKKRLPGSKCCIHFHNDPQGMSETRSVESRLRLLQEAEFIYCVSRYVRERFLQGVICGEKEQERVRIAYNGIERLSKTLPRKEKIILFVGRVVEEKGIVELAEAIAKILPSYPDWSFCLVGSQKHGKLKSQLSKVEKMVSGQLQGLTSQAHVLGYLPYAEVMRLFTNAAIVVVPSKWNEPLGRTAIEALAEGCALVSSQRGGLYEINTGCGVVLGEITAEHIALKIRLLIEDGRKMENIQQRCWDAFESFDLTKVVGALDACRRELL